MNRLGAATSPYLLQHQGNPVDWWEWEPAAFEEARRRNVPVLLSVGYAACHWCHVMAHESFEDEATAALMNERFVSIKVDREERPDVDAVYLEATTAMTGHGGWPMTCALDHDGNPFFAGTYFPDQPRHGQPSFRQVLGAISEAWQTQPDDVRRVAGDLRRHLQRQPAAPPTPADRTLLAGCVAALEQQFDPTYGGFGGAPKFPPSMVLEFLQRMGEHRMVDATLEAMARGGLYDQLGGGFARYSVDERWVVPHFEKMLYDNGLLLGVYARHDTDLARRVTDETADFLLRELRTAEGGFASAIDADSEGVEGKYYAWTPAELVEVLGEDDGRWAAELLGVTTAGTFEHGSSVLQLRADPAVDRWQRVRTALAEARARRVRPARDDKVVAAWNGLAVSGLCRAGTSRGRPELIAAARAAADLLLEVHRVDGRLRRVSRDGVVGSPAGVLEDYGCVAAGLLDLAQVTAEPRYLAAAGDLLDVALTRFRAEDGGFHDTADDAEALVARPRETSDNASPCGQSSVIAALTTYAAITGSGRHRQAAEEGLRATLGWAAHAPRFAGWFLAAAAAQVDGPVEVAVVGPDGEQRDALAEVARRHPTAVVVVAADADDAIGLLAGRTAVGGRPAAYVCRGHVCERPVTDPEELAAALSR